MAIVDVKSRDNIRVMMRELNVGDTLRVSFRRASRGYITTTASQLKRNEGLVFQVKTKGLECQLVTRIK